MNHFLLPLLFNHPVATFLVPAVPPSVVMSTLAYPVHAVPDQYPADISADAVPIPAMAKLSDSGSEERSIIITSSAVVGIVESADHVHTAIPPVHVIYLYPFVPLAPAELPQTIITSPDVDSYCTSKLSVSPTAVICSIELSTTRKLPKPVPLQVAAPKSAAVAALSSHTHILKSDEERPSRAALTHCTVPEVVVVDVGKFAAAAQFPEPHPVDPALVLYASAFTAAALLEYATVTSPVFVSYVISKRRVVGVPEEATATVQS